MTGYNRTTTVEEQDGVEMYHVAEQIGDELNGSGLSLLSVWYGDIYLAEQSDDDEPDIETLATLNEFGDRHIDAVDALGKDLQGSGYIVVEVWPDGVPQLAYVNEP